MWAVLVSVGVAAQAAPLMHGIFQDHAVLQRDRPIEVWGHAAGGEDITVALAAASVLWSGPLSTVVALGGGSALVGWLLVRFSRGKS